MTANKGAAEIRSKILRKMRELEHSGEGSISVNWHDLKCYIKGMAKRASSKPGGEGHSL